MEARDAAEKQMQMHALVAQRAASDLVQFYGVVPQLQEVVADLKEGKWPRRSAQGAEERHKGW